MAGQGVRAVAVATNRRSVLPQMAEYKAESYYRQDNRPIFHSNEKERVAAAQLVVEVVANKMDRNCGDHQSQTGQPMMGLVEMRIAGDSVSDQLSND